MKSTVVDESLSTATTSVLFQRKPTCFKIYSTEWEIYTITLTDIAWNWYEPIMNDIQDMPTWREKKLWKDSIHGDSPYKTNIHIDKTWSLITLNSNVEQFVYGLKVLGTGIGMSDEQLVGLFKEAFPAKIEAMLSEIDSIDKVIGNARVLILLFKLELPQATSSVTLAHMTEGSDDKPCKNQSNKTKPNTFHEAFGKTGIDTEG